MLQQQAIGGMGEVGRESRITIYFQTDFRMEAWQLIALLLTLLCSGIYERFDFNELYFAFFAPKIADTIILYSHKVLIIISIITVNLL